MATKTFQFSRVVRIEDENYVKLDDVVRLFDYLAVENPAFAGAFLHIREKVRDNAIEGD